MTEELKKNRCGWISDPRMQKYQDDEWGVKLL